MPTRSRLHAALLACLTIALGLASRRFGESLPSFIARYAGDALWATLVYWCLAFMRPRATARSLALGSLTIAFAVEVTQLYHAPWIDAVRATRLGALVLGHGFLWSDLACYGVGVLLAVVIDRPLARGRTG
ncbi:MAG: DUF2809 domain-containing protein [Cytophagaceae bacterium]|nr:DUF2809 domain-containing protein [Gemmatimonadaceae bacterium]